MTKEGFRKHCELQIEKCIKLHDSKHLKEHELALGLLNENKRLIDENQELKKQIDNYRNRYKNRLNEKLAEGIEPDPEDFYLAEIEGKANDYDKLQKEIKGLKTKISIAEERYKIVDEINQRYKEVIDKTIEVIKKMINQGYVVEDKETATQYMKVGNNSEFGIRAKFILDILEEAKNEKENNWFAK